MVVQGKRNRRWSDTSHDQEPLIVEILKPRFVDCPGPILELVAKKQAEQRPKGERGC